MASFFPGTQDTWVPKVDLVDTILSSHVNDLQNAVASLEIGGVSIQNIAYAASITPNVPAGEYVIVGTLTGNITINVPTNALTGRRLTFRFTQDATGGRTVAWNAIFKLTNWTINTGANAKTEATFTYDGSNWILAVNPPSGNGAVYDTGAQVVNVKTQGVVFDGGVTNNTTAINALPSNVELWWPAGTAGFGGNLSPKTGQRHSGAGIGVTVLQEIAGSNCHAFLLAGSLNHASWADMTIDGQLSVNAGNGYGVAALSNSTLTDINLDRVEFLNWGNGGVYAGGLRWKVNACRSNNCHWGFAVRYTYSNAADPTTGNLTYDIEFAFCTADNGADQFAQGYLVNAPGKIGWGTLIAKVRYIGCHAQGNGVQGLTGAAGFGVVSTSLVGSEVTPYNNPAGWTDVSFDGCHFWRNADNAGGWFFGGANWSYTGGSIDGNNYQPVTAPTGLTYAGSGGALAAGAHSIAYSLVYAWGETSLSPATALGVAAANDKINIPAALQTPPAGARAIKFYFTASTSTTGFAGQGTVAAPLATISAEGNGVANASTLGLANNGQGIEVTGTLDGSITGTAIHHTAGPGVIVHSDQGAGTYALPTRNTVLNGLNLDYTNLVHHANWSGAISILQENDSFPVTGTRVNGGTIRNSGENGVTADVASDWSLNGVTIEDSGGLGQGAAFQNGVYVIGRNARTGMARGQVKECQIRDTRAGGARTQLYGVQDNGTNDPQYVIVGGQIDNNATQNVLLTTGDGANRYARGVKGYNPVGAVTTPGFPATTVAVTNNTGVDVAVHLVNGVNALTLQVDAVAALVVIPASAAYAFELPSGSSYTPTYGGGAPSHKWYGK